jgi:hypothetical protein
VPVREPVTRTREISLAGAPRRLIWVCGEPTTEPGVGEAAIEVPGSTAEAFNTAGAHLATFVEA